MKEYTIYLYQDEIDIMVGLLDKGDFDTPSVEDALLRGILTQVLQQQQGDKNA